MTAATRSKARAGGAAPRPLRRVLIANRGEIAVRIARACRELGIESVAVYSEPDRTALHVQVADFAYPIGPAPSAQSYLVVDNILAAAHASGADGIHPGYGFLAENAAFARRCAAEGLAFVGPRAELLELLGDKARARALAERCGVPVLPGTPGATSVAEARAFLASLPAGSAIVLKAVAGGGGRGMRVVRDPDALADAWERCRSEARAAFGDGALYAERLLPRARHVEVQIVGDRAGAVGHLWERDCSLQRRHQKLVEVAPSPRLAAPVRERVIAAALRMAEEVRYDGVGTFEFLIDATGAEQAFFIEANPRLQVEHTVTEEVTGIDLVRTQLRLAAGATLADLGLRPGEVPTPRGFALQLRINMERMQADGSATPAGGTLLAFEPPSGHGVRVETLGYAGYTPSPRFDSLLAKLVVHAPAGEFRDVVARAYRALCELKVDGVPTNAGFLQALLRHPAVATYEVDTRFVETHAAELLGAPADEHRRLFFETASGDGRGAPPAATARASTPSIRWRCSSTARAAADAPPPMRPPTRPPAASPSARRCRARSCRSRCGRTTSSPREPRSSSWRP
jgi:acetyl/propionyl-CoA carboxylase alpha subunit